MIGGKGRSLIVVGLIASGVLLWLAILGLSKVDWPAWMIPEGGGSNSNLELCRDAVEALGMEFATFKGKCMGVDPIRGRVFVSEWKKGKEATR